MFQSLSCGNDPDDAVFFRSSFREDDHGDTVFHHADAAPAVFTIVVARVMNKQHGRGKHPADIREVDAVLSDIRPPLFRVPLESHSSSVLTFCKDVNTKMEK